jgi:hypothetical protein
MDKLDHGLSWRTQVHISRVITVAFGAIASITASAQNPQTEHPINSVREIKASLRACWVSPEMRTPAQVTVRLSLNRDGEIFGRPLVTHQNPDLSEGDRAALHAAVATTLARCSPLPISDTLGGIIAGHPINVRLGDGWTRRRAAAPTDR